MDCIEAELVNIKNKHGKRVAYISIRMAEYWKIQGDELQYLAMCALLHDIGKMAVGNEILEKPDKLTDDEFSKMKNHAGYTYLILSEVNDLKKYETGQLSIMKN